MCSWVSLPSSSRICTPASTSISLVTLPAAKLPPPASPSSRTISCSCCASTSADVTSKPSGWSAGCKSSTM
eukprot:5156034-Pleurochrysis_carterae.AAC.2